MYELILIAGGLAAAVVVLCHFWFRGNAVTPWLLPRFLDGLEYSRAELRRAGTGWIVTSLWAITMSAALFSAITPETIEKTPALFGLIVFVVPVVAICTLIAGIFCLGAGIFSRRETVVGFMQPVIVVDAGQLDRYIRRLKWYTWISLCGIPVAIAALFIEVRMGVSWTGIAPVLNIALVATVILTHGRTRAYLTKAALLMNYPEEKVFDSAFTVLWFAWINSFLVQKEYVRSWQGMPPRDNAGGVYLKH